ncbi:MAG: hemolysin family protein, partial [Oscillospiraceae bacterium]
MDDVGQFLITIIPAVIFLIFAAILVIGEVSISSCNESKLKHLAKENEAQNKSAEKLLYYKENENKFCLVARIGTAICLSVSCLIGTLWLYAVLQSVLINIVAVFVALMLSVFVVLTFGYALPYQIATYKNEKTAFKLAGAISFLFCIFKFFSFAIIKIANALSLLFGVDLKNAPIDVTEEEIRLMVDVGNESGTIEQSEREMINNIFEFDDLTAGEVMTHRTDLSAVSLNGKLSDVIKIAMDEGFSRIPVYEDDIDNIVGILYVKDLLPLISEKKSEEEKIDKYMRGVIYAPESARCRGLFRKFKEKKTHMAVIVDEYGGTAGIVTMEDLLEEIVGNIYDEYDPQDEDEITKISEDTWSVLGSLDIDTLEDELE